MSEKKAQDNKKDKGGKLIHVTEEQIQAGKAELLKIVAGTPGAEKLAETLEKSKKKGRMVASEIMEALEEVALDSEQMDKIYDILENMGIDTAGEAYLPDLTNDDGMPPLEEIEEIPLRERAGEYLMTRLRTTAGISREEYEKQYLLPFDPIEEGMKKLREHKLATQTDEGRWHLTPKGYLLSNTIISDLLDAQDGSTPLRRL